MYHIATQMPSPEALGAIRAWVTLDRAFAQLNTELRRRHGITGAQLALLRIVAEREPITLADLRTQLAMHPATIGQLVDRIVRLRFLKRRRSAIDARRQELALTPRGRRLISVAPIAGPVRLRTARDDPERLTRLADALRDAVSLFGMEEWA